MSDTLDGSFDELMRRVRRGDEEAASDLLRRYEPQVRRIVRICQSVMADFFVRVAAGQFELDSLDKLIKLLATMARNKVKNHAQRQQADKRDVRRVVEADVDDMKLQAAGHTPSSDVSNKELL